jgi:low affinity Fe/Cu permease
MFERFASVATHWCGSAKAFVYALIVVALWAITGPIFNFSDTWQLVINTGTTIITFLMVFVIQHSANKDNLAVQAKLNEIVKAMKEADNHLIAIEDMSEEELLTLHRRQKSNAVQILHQRSSSE